MIRPILLLAMLAALPTIGCGGAPNRVPCVPATGTVLVDGQPAAGVRVTLVPADRVGDLDALRPSGVTGPDGAFAIGTYEKDDGSPPGRYRVTLFLPDAEPTGSNSPNDLLGGRYLDPAKSTIEATVAESATKLPAIEVKTPGRPARPAPTKKRARPDNDGVG